ncbi:MarR family transcriptional regulator [Glutamicibacter uratoxydans]|uniref:MarR family transcriptional regulator n=1 Tax=Glutamicibacter uratoxydans TaxID=43667 RepID=A0A4Y4DRA8_GLUUR|nr:MarR family transcriptional regulator [Glutamicibacter uratoxydans]GED06464.1 MarR family transcriptional regulator [Glutamicibacter uratoxydans]
MSNDPLPANDIAAGITMTAGTMSRLLGHIAGQGRSVTAWRVLAGLDRDGAQRVGDLAIGQRVAQPTMTGLVIRLEQDGMVIRQTDPRDRRVSLVALTERGKQEVDGYRARAIQALGGTIGELSTKEQVVLSSALPLLQRLCEDMAAELDKA